MIAERALASWRSLALRMPRALWTGMATTLLVLLLLAVGACELRSSRVQAWYLSKLARRLTFHLGAGPSPEILYPQAGPYDLRMGYARLPEFLSRLEQDGYHVTTQARSSPRLLRLSRWLFPIYREKTQAGLRILDRDDRVLFSAAYPERVYAHFHAIPSPIVEALLFIENRELLDSAHPRLNPAVEWDRLAKALLENTLHTVDRERGAPGGSTVATQLEKFRHSPAGRTPSMGEKLRQMASASVRAYLEGEETLDTRRGLLVDYINSIPLAALPGYGEVNGLGDGLWAWYGSDFDRVNRLLSQTGPGQSEADAAAAALAYKQVVSLFVAHRRPSYYLLAGRAALGELTDRYLRILGDAGVLAPAQRDAALRAELRFQEAQTQAASPFVERKSAHAVRARLLPLLGLQHLYDLDRLDLTVATSLDQRAQQEVSHALKLLGERRHALAAGLIGDKLLDRGDFSRVIYSFTLYERVGDASMLRVQTDNFEQPLNINEGVKLELGSTAKLRTLLTYLEIVSALHAKYGTAPHAELLAARDELPDPLTRWGVEHLARARDRSLAAMLEAAMQRRYSASPWESFFTGGGRHTFENFDPEDNDRVMTVREGFRRSVNLVFIRLMRDVVDYYTLRVPGSSAKLLADAQDPTRQLYLSRFADREGRIFMRRFERKYRGLSPSEMLERLLEDVRPTPRHQAVVFRSVRPEAGVAELARFLGVHLRRSTLSPAAVQELFDRFSPDKMALVDRAYVAGVHPLELWTVAYLSQHPRADALEIIEAGAKERQEVYRWLFKTRRKGAQDTRIRSLLEVEAFLEIHRAWRRQGYPFSSLVPSYATAIGSSADRPAALAELIGTILNGGVQVSTIRVSELRFAQGTPYETWVERRTAPGAAVIPPQVARVVREELVGVVESGSATRVRGAFRLRDGTPLVVGGKTGTGDNRHYVYGPNGALVDSWAVNRTATFVFMIGDRMFGAVTAYVPGPRAAEYGFTSSLPVQLLDHLAPRLMPLLERPVDRP
jgi:membrane peptidoglycan carboxypeptidase